MTDVFLNLINRSIAAGWLVLAVLLLRFLLKSAPKSFRCILWGLVGLRLICPFSIQSIFSLVPSAQTISRDILYAQAPAIHSGV
ncbi:MAG: M56 family metallopeptidase, partial [Candidatus Faecousia sp.]|nr:M56 family metallopeptidase [Candidatus Faecousia sp.]